VHFPAERSMKQFTVGLDAYAFDNVSLCRKGKKSLLDKGLAASIQVNS